MKGNILTYPAFLFSGLLALTLGLANPLPSAAEGSHADNSAGANEAAHLGGAASLQLEKTEIMASFLDNEQDEETVIETPTTANASESSEAAGQISQTDRVQSNNFVLRGTLSAMSEASLTIGGKTVTLDPAITGQVNETGALRVGDTTMVTGVIVNDQLYAQTVHTLPAQARGKPAALFVAPSLGATGQAQVKGTSSPTATAAAATSTKTTAATTTSPSAQAQARQTTSATMTLLSHVVNDLQTFFQQLFA